MCGICGLIEFGTRTPDTVAVIERMTATLKHRGPDRSAVVAEGPAALGHTRLSIIDLTEAGNQPMKTPNGRYTLVFNGEVYNYRDLRLELVREGVRFRGDSDSEVVARAMELWGVGALPRLNGIFALAVWDHVSNALILARDRFGVKPLYYAETPAGLIFGSEIKALLVSDMLPVKVDAQALHEFTYFGVGLGTRTLFKGVKKLEPGHWMRFSESGMVVEPYWRVEDVPEQNDHFATAADHTRNLLEAAVRRQLVSDVPVGVFLSGGIDSSAVTAFATRHYEGRLRTFSVGFDFDRGVNELPKARRVAEYYGTEHSELHLAGGNVPDVIEALVRHHDAPFSDAANIPLYLLCRELNGEPRVILQGDGGDEIFAGYRRYSLVANIRWLTALSSLHGVAAMIPGDAWRRLQRLLAAFNHSEPAVRSASLLTLDTPRSSLANHLSADWATEVSTTDPFMRYRDITERFRTSDPVEQLLRTDTCILLPDVFLEKVDRSTMAFGIESRVPFLDNELTEYVLGLPSSVKVQGREKKRVLKMALRGIVPDDILDGPKTGFGVPFSHWLATSLYSYARDVLMEEVRQPDSFFDRDSLPALLETHRISPSEQSGFILWKALNLALWKREYLVIP